MDPKPVYAARNSSEAAMVRNWLEQAGISSSILGGEAQSGTFEIIEAEPVVVVSADDHDRAVAALDEFRQQLQSGAGLDEMSEAEGQFNWPLCPVCDELRPATCRQCGKTGSEYSAEVQDEELQVFCLACSQQVEVDFAGICPWCRHDYDSDVAEDQSPGAAESGTTFNASRGMGLILVMLIVFAAIAAAILFS